MIRVSPAVVFIVLCIACCLFAHDDSTLRDAAYIKCLENCWFRERRHCVQAPDKCGECLLSYTAVNGVCQPINQQHKSDIAATHLGSNDADDEPAADAADAGPSASSDVVQHDDVISEHDNIILESVHQRPLLETMNSTVIIAVVIFCALAAAVGVIIIVICLCRMLRRGKTTSDADYPAYGSTDQSRTAAALSERKLAHSAQMFHFQHQKQQMLALERSSGSMSKTETASSDEEQNGDEDEYKVYECRGLAPTEEMEVDNPLYMDPTLTTSSSLAASSQVHSD